MAVDLPSAKKLDQKRRCQLRRRKLERGRHLVVVGKAPRQRKLGEAIHDAVERQRRELGGCERRRARRSEKAPSAIGSLDQALAELEFFLDSKARGSRERVWRRRCSRPESDPATRAVQQFGAPAPTACLSPTRSAREARSDRTRGRGPRAVREGARGCRSAPMAPWRRCRNPTPW